MGFHDAIPVRGIDPCKPHSFVGRRGSPCAARFPFGGTQRSHEGGIVLFPRRRSLHGASIYAEKTPITFPYPSALCPPPSAQLISAPTAVYAIALKRLFNTLVLAQYSVF